MFHPHKTGNPNLRPASLRNCWSADDSREADDGGQWSVVSGVYADESGEEVIGFGQWGPPVSVLNPPDPNPEPEPEAVQ